jgi:hypothetical protein
MVGVGRAFTTRTSRRPFWRPGGGGPSVLRGVHHDGIVVVKRGEVQPVLVGKHRMGHDVGGWRVEMLEIRLSRDALTMVANRIELRAWCAFE